MNESLFSSASVEWATPWEFFRQLDAEFHFDLDPCSTHENAKCTDHFTKAEDGLSRDWGAKGYFAIRHTAESFRSGLRRRTMKRRKARSW